MQTVTAPSRSKLLGSLKNSFAIGSLQVTPQQLTPIQQTPPPATDVEIELSNDQKLEVFDSVLQEIDGGQVADSIPATASAPSPLLTFAADGSTVPADPQVVVPVVAAHVPVPTVVVPPTQGVAQDAQAQSTVEPAILQPQRSASATISQVQTSPVPPTIEQITTNTQSLQAEEQPIPQQVASPAVAVQDQAAVVPTPPSPAVQQNSSSPTDTTDTSVLGQLAASIDPQQINSLNPPAPVGTTHKEALGGGALTVEANPGGGAAVEIEPQKEISPEVESYIQKVEEQDQLPQEIVIADGNVTLSPVQYPAQPVIVLPLTPEIEAEADKKNASFSVRWLKEWCHKLIKMFAGKVIYRQE